jgi:hypothetical protein
VTEPYPAPQVHIERTLAAYSDVVRGLGAGPARGGAGERLAREIGRGSAPSVQETRDVLGRGGGEQQGC